MNPVTTITLPLSGQFVATYIGGDSDDRIFSVTLRWVDGDLQAYDGFKDEWVGGYWHGYSPAFLRSASAIYILI